MPFSCTECGWSTNAPSRQEGGGIFGFFFVFRGVGVPIEYTYHVPWIWVNLIVSFEFWLFFSFWKFIDPAPPLGRGGIFGFFFICRWVGVPIEYSYHVPWIWVNLIVSFEFGHFSDFENSPPPWRWGVGSEKKIRGAGGPREYIKKVWSQSIDIFPPNFN